jgi:hypothetical protein
MKKIVFYAATVIVACLSVSAYPAVRVLNEGKTAVARFNAAHVPVKEVISSKQMKNGSEFRIVRLENGMIKKQVLRAGKKSHVPALPQVKSNPVTGLRASNAADRLFEGFETWDGKAWDWLPEGWSDKSGEGAAEYVEDAAGERVNFTWYVTKPFFDVFPKGGQYFAYVQFPYPVEIPNDAGGTEFVTQNLQDQWLISPPVNIAQADYVAAFDLHYDPAFGRAEYDEDGEMTGNFTAMHTLVEAYISEDGGDNWTKKWDNREDAARYTDIELERMFTTGAPWIEVSFEMADYLGKDVRLAIRYWDDGGESVFVDNAVIGYQATEASYRRPEGYLISGFSTDYQYETDFTIFGHAYTPTRWKGDVKHHTSVTWSFNDRQGNAVSSFPEQNPIVTLPPGWYETPLLTATGKDGTAEFQLNKNTDEDISYVRLGGQNRWEYEDATITFGLGNYDLQYDYATYTDINTESLAPYGTFRGIVNDFEKPVAKYLIKTFYVHAENVVPKDGEPVKLTLYAVNDDGSAGEIIAESEALPEDFEVLSSDDANKFYTIPFEFIVPDHTGRESKGYLEIDDRFRAEFYNYQAADVFFQYMDHPTGDRYASVSFEDREPLSLGATSALFDMDAVFPFLYTTGESRFTVPNTLNIKTLEIATYWEPEDTDNGWQYSFPSSWIHVKQPVKLPESDFLYTLEVGFDSLPADLPGRSGDLTILAPGCELTFRFKQGNAAFSSVNPVRTANAVKVFSQGDRFLLNYPAETTSVVLYGAAGQKIAEYPLHSSGACSIPAAHLPRGVYILKFAGKTNESVKILK